MWFKQDEKDKSKASCTICNSVLTCGEGKKRSTSSMKKHLQGKHSYHYGLAFPNNFVQENEPEDKNLDEDGLESESGSEVDVPQKKPKYHQPSLEDCVKSLKPWDINDKRSVNLHEAIGEMIALDGLPYSSVENEGFKRVMLTAQPHYEVFKTCH